MSTTNNIRVLETPELNLRKNETGIVGTRWKLKRKLQLRYDVLFTANKINTFINYDLVKA